MFRAIGTDDSCRGAFDGRGLVVLLNPPSGGFFIAQLDKASMPGACIQSRPTNDLDRGGWLNTTVRRIGVVSLFSGTGHEMATAAMPALLAMLGATPAALGLIEGLVDGLSSFAKLLWGLDSDRLKKRKPLAVVGYFVTALGMASFALATQWWQILIGRIGARTGRGARTPIRNVLLTEAATPQTYGRAFELERAMDSAGAALGPGLALLLVLALEAGLIAAAPPSLPSADCEPAGARNEAKVAAET